MLIMLIMLVKKVAQSCRLGNKAEFVHKPIGNMNQSKNLTLLTISRFSGRQLDYILITLRQKISLSIYQPSHFTIPYHQLYLIE